MFDDNVVKIFFLPPTERHYNAARVRTQNKRSRLLLPTTPRQKKSPCPTHCPGHGVVQDNGPLHTHRTQNIGAIISACTRGSSAVCSSTAFGSTSRKIKIRHPTRRRMLFKAGSGVGVAEGKPKLKGLARGRGAIYFRTNHNKVAIERECEAMSETE